MTMEGGKKQQKSKSTDAKSDNMLPSFFSENKVADAFSFS